VRIMALSKRAGPPLRSPNEMRPPSPRTVNNPTR
jgi:hypothetical protein